MSSESVALLVKFLPTILTAVCIFLCMLRGFLRGFRKSVILLIHYIISLAAGLFVYFEATKIVLSDELNSILASISPEFADANSLYDVVGILVNSYLPEFASLIGNEHLQQVVMTLVGVGVSLVFGIVCLIVFPWVVRVVLYLLYLLFYREGKVKRHKEAEGDDYSQYSPESKKAIAACASIAVSVKSVLDTPLLTDDGLLTEDSENTSTNIEGFLNNLQIAY